MPEYYCSLEKYQEHCLFWGDLEQCLNKKFKPNPWLFKCGQEVLPGGKKYAITFKNFDDSKHLHVTVDYADGKFKYTFSNPD